jgi:hypothetical protein
LKRKNICEPINTHLHRDIILDDLLKTPFNNILDISNYKCQYCNKVFKQRQGKHRHETYRCTFKQLSTQINDQLIDNQSTSATFIDTQNNNNMTNINSHNTTNQLQINNQINNYGNEDIAYITKEKYKEILKNPFSSLSKLINEVHFNDEHPENKNVRIPNKKQPFIEFYDDGWVIRNQYKFVCKLFFSKKDLLHEAYLEVEDMLDDKTKELYKYFLEEAERNVETLKSQLKDIQAAILSGTRKRVEYIQ